MRESPFQGLSPSAAPLQPPLRGSPVPAVTAGLQVLPRSGCRSEQLWPGLPWVHPSAALPWTPEGAQQYPPPRGRPPFSWKCLFFMFETVCFMEVAAGRYCSSPREETPSGLPE